MPRFPSRLLKNGVKSVFSIAALLSIGLSVHLAIAKTPPLPESLKQNTDGKMVLVDFYSEYCGTCQMMFPKLKSLQRKVQDKIAFKHIDVGGDGNRSYWQDFSLHGTPTYVLYDASGTPVYKMQESIAPLILEKQLLRHTGQLRPVELPQEISLPTLNASEPGDLDHLILLSFENDTCVDCKDMAPYLSGFEISGKENLKVLRLNTKQDSTKRIMAQMGIRKLPAYAILDNAIISPSNLANNRRSELFVLTGKVPPKILWDVIRIFGDSGV